MFYYSHIVCVFQVVVLLLNRAISGINQIDKSYKIVVILLNLKLKKIKYYGINQSIRVQTEL